MSRTENAPAARGANLTAAMAEHRYDPHAIEPNWQEIWEREHTWQVVQRRRRTARQKSYVLEMLPVPVAASRTWGT